MNNIKLSLIAATIMSSLSCSAMAATSAQDTEYPFSSKIEFKDGKVRVNDFVAIQTFRLTKEDVMGIKVSHDIVKKEDAENLVKRHATIDNIILPIGTRYLNKKDINPENLLFTNIPVKMNRIHAVGDKQDTSLFVQDKNKTGIKQKIEHAISFKYDINMSANTKKRLEEITMKMSVAQDINNGKIVKDVFNRTGASKVSVIKVKDGINPYNETSWFAEQTVTGPMLVGITPGTAYNQEDLKKKK